MALAYTAPTWTDGSGTGISASQLQALCNCVEGLVQGSDKAVTAISIDGSVITMTFADGSQDTGTVTNLKGILSVTKTSVGLIDTYTIVYTDGSTYQFTVKNGKDGTGTGDMEKVDYDPDSDVLNAGGIPDYVEDRIGSTTLAVDLLDWTTDTTSQSGTTLYKKAISLTSVYVESPSVDIGAGTGYVLPTSAEQESYNLIQYVTVDDTVPCLYLYASEIPTTAFYIKVVGVE